MPLIYKICPAALWREAEKTGAFAGAPVDLRDGFIHFSTGAQVPETAARHFAGESDLLLIAVDPAALGEALRFEPSRGGDLFPHLYGPLPMAAVRLVDPLPLGAEGRQALPAYLAVDWSDLATAGWRPLAGLGFSDLVGPFYARAQGPAGHYAFRADAKHVNVNGMVHGGMITTFADQTLALACLADRGESGPQVTIQLDAQFVGGVRLGELVEARCRVVRRTRTLAFMAGDFAVGDRPIASANGIWRILG